jgi:peptide subunit release factor 1 (eRF1)
VVVVSRQGARFFRYYMGEIEEEPGHPLTLDISEWRHMGLVMGVGDEHDAFDQRKREHYRRFFEHLAGEIARWSGRERLQPIALLGNPRAIETVVAALPEDFQDTVVSAAIQPARATRSQIIRRAEPVMDAWRRERERQDVATILEQSERPEVVTGLTATLSALQQGRARKLLAARGLRGRVRQCPRCGWVDRSPQEECPQCGRHERLTQSLRAVLPALARARGVAVEIVAGAAAERLLAEAEGLAAWLRAAGERPVEAPAA